MLALDWYITHPIDFEHKHYLLLDWTQKVDLAFRDRQLSPYLLWTESLLKELHNFNNNRIHFQTSLEKKIIQNNEGLLSYNIIKPETPEWLEKVIEIIDFSAPVLQSRIDLGYNLLKKFPQILY